MRRASSREAVSDMALRPAEHALDGHEAHVGRAAPSGSMMVSL